MKELEEEVTEEAEVEEEKEEEQKEESFTFDLDKRNEGAGAIFKT